MRHPTVTPLCPTALRERSIPVWVALSLLLPLLLLLTSQATALPPETDESELWVPSISTGLGVTFTRAAGSLITSDVTGNQFSTENSPVVSPIQPTTWDSNVLATPSVFVGLELMTPRLSAEWGMPRFFVHGDVGYQFGSTTGVARTGLVGPFEPAPRAQEFTQFVNADVVLGQGAIVNARVRPLQVSAGVGVAFSFDLADFRVRVKPSLEYLRERVAITGEVTRAINQNQMQSSVNDLRLIRFKQERDKVYHSIGPGIQVEADAARLGDFIFTPFIGGQFVYSLTGRRTQFGQGQIPPCTPDFGCVQPVAAETAAWTFKKDPWTYRTNAGIRVRFAPK